MTTLYDLNAPSIKIGQAISGSSSVSATSGTVSSTVYTVPSGQYAIINIFDASAYANSGNIGYSSSSSVTISGVAVVSNSKSDSAGSSTVSSGVIGPIYVGPGQSIVISAYRSSQNNYTGASASIRFAGLTFEQA